MCAAMIAMAWPVGMGFARVPQIVLFTIAAVWFAGILVVGRHRHAGHHAVMMAAMVFAMPLAMGGGIAAIGEAGGEHAAHLAGSGGLSGAQLPTRPAPPARASTPP